MSRQVGQRTQHQHYRHRYGREQAIQTIREVGAVRHGRHDKDRHGDIQQPRQVVVATHQPAVVELVVLDEGNRSLRRLLRCGAEHRGALLDLGIARLAHIYGHGRSHLLTNHHLLREAHHRAHDNTQADLTHDLELTLQAILVVAEGLDIVVQEAQQAEPQRRDEHQDNVDIIQTSHQQHRHQDSQQDDDSAHRRCALF